MDILLISIGILALFLVLLQNPSRGIWLIGLSSPFGQPFDTTLIVTSSFTLGLGIFEISVLLTGVAFVLHQLVAERPIRLPNRAFTVFFSIFIGVSIMSLFVSYNLALSMRNLITYFFLLFAIFLLENLVHKSIYLKWLIYSILIGGVLSLIIGVSGAVVAGVSGTENIFARYFGEKQVPGFTFRLVAFSGDPNVYGGLLLVIFLMLLTLGSYQSSVILVGMAGVVLIGLLLTFSRGAWIGLTAIGILLYYFAKDHRGRIVRTILRSVVTSAVVLALVFSFLGNFGLTKRILSAAIHRIYTLSPRIVEESTPRFYIWRSALNAFASHPLLGVGVGAFSAAHPYYAVAQDRYVTQVAHNMYLEILTGVGLLGAIPFFGILWMIFDFGRKNIRIFSAQKSSLEYQLSVACFSAYVALLIAGLNLSMATYRYFWVLGALILLLHKFEKKQRQTCYDAI